MACSSDKLVCLECQDAGRASLAREIHETLKTRGMWAPSFDKFMNYHDKTKTCDLIGAVALAIDGLRQDLMQSQSEIQMLRAMAKLEKL
jgi:hypothetical protein